MKVIKPRVDMLRTGMETDIVPEKFIELVGRTCYKSEDKITGDSAAKFVGNLIKRGHEAMLEHWSLIFMVEDDMQFWGITGDYAAAQEKGMIRPYLRVTAEADHTRGNGYTRNIISGNMRAWRDFIKAYITSIDNLPLYLYDLVRDYPVFFPEYQSYILDDTHYGIMTPITANDLVGPIEHDVHHDVTVKFICDRGVSHELVRHRTASFAQESTRYCNYSGDKFGNEITVVAPSWCIAGSKEYNMWLEGCKWSESCYFDLSLNAYCTPQQARSVLPNSLKTEVVKTASLMNWRHFFKLRCDLAAHPDMQVSAGQAKEQFGKFGVYGYATPLED